MVKVILSCAMAAIAASKDAPAEVYDLTASTFDDFIAENKKTLAAFVAPWCGHCKALKPAYQEAAEALKAEGLPVKLAYIDATVETSLAERFGVQGFPTIKYFDAGVDSEYDGGRTKDDIVAWLKEQTQPAVTVVASLDEDGVKAPTKVGEKPRVLLSAPEGSDAASAFEAAASPLRRAATFVQLTSAETPSVKIQHPGEAEVVLTGTIDADTIAAFVKANKLPKFGVLNGDTFAAYTEQSKGLVWVLVPTVEDADIAEVVAPIVDAMRAAADNAEVADKYAMTYTDTFKFKDALDAMLSVTEFPALVVQKTAQDKKKFVLPMSGEITEAFTTKAVVDFIAKVNAGEVEPVLKSEPVPETQESAVFKAVGSNLGETLFDAERDVMLAVTAPWCGHCKKLHPEYIKVAKKIAKEGLEGKLRLAELDGTANDSPLDSVDWTGFPTMFFVAAGSDKVESYEGPRTAKGLWKWIKDNSTYSEEIKAAIDAKKDDKTDDDKDEKKDEL